MSTQFTERHAIIFLETLARAVAGDGYKVTVKRKDEENVQR